MNETTILQCIRLAVSKVPGVRLFRNQVGALKDKSGRLVTFGLHPGSADLIGWKSIRITPEMVGRKVAVFVSIECKTPDGKVRPDQEHWRFVIQEAGGIACIARGEETALQCLTK